MEWLKDKKNLPIVIGIAVFVLLASGGLMAFDLGLFPSSSPAPLAPEMASRGGPTPPSAADTADPKPPAPPAVKPPAPPAPPRAIAAKPGAKKAGAAKTASAAAPAASTVVDPTKGPDPFLIPGGQKKMAALLAGEGVKGVYGMKAPLRDILPSFDLFNPQSGAGSSPSSSLPAPPNAPGNGGLPLVAAKKVVSGIVTGADGISAILEVNGQSQNVKPGDSLQDGSKVVSIQTTSVTIREADGSISSVPLTSGSGDPSQGGAVPPAPGQPFNGQPQPVNGQPQPFGQ